MSATWHFIVDCATCGEVIDLGPAPSPSEQEPATHRGVQKDCPHCGAGHTYPAGRVKRGLVEHEDE